eukprot:TRINITY_DN15722_c0_g2_i5.p1 TRINITY_DN15722_c0_g2~~TRINITY_DN15722_c0_g2_i5.p1  ORF type:complete len:258 (-),score=27.74 TRINITY_DN15722_c0_g2_i5:106-879(-)
MRNVSRTEYVSEPVNAKMLASPEFRTIKNKSSRKQQFNIRLRQKFGERLDEQAWKTFDECPLREEYKGGFEETGNLDRKRDKRKELSKNANLADKVNTMKKNLTQSTSIRQFISQNAINEITRNSLDQAHQTIKAGSFGDKRNEEKSREEAYFNTYTTLFTITKPETSATSNIKPLSAFHSRPKIYKKSMEDRRLMGKMKRTAHNRRNGSFHITVKEQVPHAHWMAGTNTNFDNVNRLLKEDRRIKTPADNFNKQTL